MKNILKSLCAASLLGAAVSASAQTFAQWNFNGTSPTTVPGGSTTPTVAIGTGSASLFGSTTADTSFGSGTNNGGSSDPVVGTPSDYAWQTTTYGADTNAAIAGVQFLIPTSGFTAATHTGFTFSYDLRHSNTSSRFEQVVYTTNGSTWSNAGSFFTGASGDTWFNGRSVTITDLLAFDNANFGLRVTTSNGSGSALVGSNGTYASTGTWLQATAIPEPSSYAAVFGVFALAGAALRRRSRK